MKKSTTNTSGNKLLKNRLSGEGARLLKERNGSVVKENIEAKKTI